MAMICWPEHQGHALLLIAPALLVHIELRLVLFRQADHGKVISNAAALPVAGQSSLPSWFIWSNMRECHMRCALILPPLLFLALGACVAVTPAAPPPPATTTYVVPATPPPPPSTTYVTPGTPYSPPSTTTVIRNP
jgi:hypothetical protein